MKRVILFTLIILFISHGIYAATEDSKYNKIVIDGFTNDYTYDESLLGSLEPDNDSNWGSNEEIKDIYITWDKNYLYIALDGICWGNGIIIYIQVGPDTVLQDANGLNSWARKIKFPADFGPDYFIAFWDQQTPSLWKISSSSYTEQIQNTSSVAGAASINQSVEGSIEVRVAWSLFFSDVKGYTLKKNTNLKICAVLVGGDYQSGPDIAPDNSVGAPQDISEYIYADNYIIVPIDANGDSEPDIGIKPNEKRTFKFSLPFSAPEEIISNLNITPNPFSPNNDGKDENLNITFTLNASALLNIEVFDLLGNSVATIKDNEYTNAGSISLSWDGKNESSETQNMGIYILKITINNQRVIKRGIALIK